MKPLLFLYAFSLALLGSAFFSGCASPDPEVFERDDYFGGHGNAMNPKHYIPKEVQR